MTNRIDAALALLAPHLCTVQEPLYFRSLLEDVYDGAQDDLLSDLIDADQVASLLSVSRRRANAYIAALHQRYGYGKRLGGAWIIRRAHVTAHPPDARYRRK